MAIVSLLLTLLAYGGGPGEEIGPPVTEETEPNAGEALEEEPAPPPGEDTEEPETAPHAAPPARARPDAQDLPATRATVEERPSAADAGGGGAPRDGDGGPTLLLMALAVLLAAGATFAIARRRPARK